MSTGELRPVVDEEQIAPVGDPPDRHRTARSLRRTLVVTVWLDVVILLFSVLLAWNLRFVVQVWDFSVSAPVFNLVAALAILVIWIVVLSAKGAYSIRNLAEGADEYRNVASASVLTLGVVAAISYFTKLEVARGFVVLAFVCGLPLLLLGRYMVRQSVYSLRRNGRMLHESVVVGGPSGVSEVVDALQRSPYVGYRVVGACLPGDIVPEPERLPVPFLGGTKDLRQLCDDVGADTVIIARGGFDTDRQLRRIAWELEGTSIDLVVVPSLTDVTGSRVNMRPVAGLPLLHVEQPQAAEATGVEKRLFDLVVGLLLVLAFSPLMVVVALLVRMEDRGPVFFKQPRVGRDGTEFGCYKFRSMFAGADQQEALLRAASEHQGPLWKMEADPRITRVGAVIRRLSIDELPQLFNVLRGEMSLVGPRPQQDWEVESYTDWEDRRLRVRPGMTGLWQVSGRSQLSFDEAIRLDLYYVDNWSMTADLVIMLKTLKAVVSRDGAY